MKNILNILLIAILTLLLFNLFNWGNNNNENNNTLNISFVEDRQTIPASVSVWVNNQTSSWVTLNTCEDLQISYSWERLNFPESLCSDITVAAWENYVVDYSEYYNSFNNVWNYNLNSEIWDKTYYDQLEVRHSWTIKKIFVWLFYAPIYNLVIFLVDLFNGSFGWAVVWVTIILRIILLWPQHKMMVAQRKLQAIQPKIKIIQEEHKWNQQMIWMKMMELYKKEKVNPVWSCGFLIIQMPILLVIYYIIIWIQDPANVYYLYSFFDWFTISDINFDFYWLDLLKNWWIQWLILALIVAWIQFIQIKLSLSSKPSTPKSEWVVLEKKSWSNSYQQMMPDPEMINKFMLIWMPIMVWIFTFSLFAAVWIYWGISTTFMLFQQLIVNKILKK